MFGKVRRSSSSSLEVLELERSPSKIIKQDSLSIYETTLMKLKQGSRHALSSFAEDYMKADRSNTSASISPCDEAMTIDTDCSPTTTSPISSDYQSTDNSKEQPIRNMSVLYLFSRYKSSKHAVSLCDEEASPSPSDCQLMSSTKQHLQQQCVSYSPVKCKI